MSATPGACTGFSPAAVVPQSKFTELCSSAAVVSQSKSTELSRGGGLPYETDGDARRKFGI